MHAISVMLATVVTMIMMTFFALVAADPAEAAFQGGRDVLVLAPAVREMDADKDGAVTREEFANFNDRFFGELDRSGDNRLSGDELSPDHPLPEPTIIPMLNLSSVRKLDKNSDGRLSLTEFIAPSEAVFARLDTDRDGNLSQAEAAKRLPKTLPAPQ